MRKTSDLVQEMRTEAKNAFLVAIAVGFENDTKFVFSSSAHPLEDLNKFVQSVDGLSEVHLDPVGGPNGPEERQDTRGRRAGKPGGKRPSVPRVDAVEHHHGGSGEVDPHRRADDAAPVQAEVPTQSPPPTATAAPSDQSPAVVEAATAAPAQADSTAQTQPEQAGAETALTFNLSGGVIGFCDTLTVKQSGEYVWQSCEDQQSTGQLASDDLELWQSWLWRKGGPSGITL